MGSKRKIAKYILPIILKDRKPGQWYVEPFCGGCNTLELVTGKRMAGDIHSELIAMYKAMQKGWRPPEYISEEYYTQIKVSGSPELKGYAGFTHSFGNIYFGTYRRSSDAYGKIGVSRKDAPKNLKSNALNQAYNGIKEREKFEVYRKLLKEVQFYNLPYYDLPYPSKSIIYCDPPYEGTSGYKTARFNSDNFWQWAIEMRKEGHTVFVSEYNGPVKPVWEKKVTTQLSSNNRTSSKRTEKLFKL